ncbi:MAG: hypothetical protein IPL72_00010 [Sulfuritalea sp.]|nr:hypothetical protein [Sulfuritalea sp.]
MVVHQLRWGTWKATSPPLRQRGRHLLQGRVTKIKVWGDNVRLITTGVIAGLVVAMAVVAAGAAKIRGFSLLLELVPALMPIFRPRIRRLVWFFGTTCTPLGRLHRQALHAHGIRRGARWRSSPPIPIPTGATACC